MIAVGDIIEGLLEDAERALAAGVVLKALTIYQGVLAHDPDHVLALRQAGAIALHHGDPATALQFFDRALKLKPTDADLYVGIGTSLRELGQTDQAILALDGAVRIDPSHKPALYDLGLLYRQKGDYARAEQMLRRAAAHANAAGESRFEAELQRAVALYRQDRLPEAERWFHRAGLLNPRDPRPFINVALIYRTWGHLDAAEKWLMTALELAPDNADAHWGLANLLLVKGELARGFAEYEWRFRRAGREARVFDPPQWSGEPLAGKTLVLTAEQGQGDMIHFARFAADFAARGARVILECHPGLERLLATVPGVSGVITLGAPLPRADFHLPLMSAAHALGIAADSVPARVPYVAVPAGCAPVNLEAPGVKVGVVWRGNPKHENDHLRSVALSVLAPVLAVEGAAFHALQLGEARGELAAFPAVRDMAADLTDFAATAAIVERLDVVITVDTAVAHLAGALGKPAWVLIARGNDWRWLHGRSDTPWYPTLRLFRQAPPRDWSAAVNAMAAELRRLVERKKR